MLLCCHVQPLKATLFTHIEWIDGVARPDGTKLLLYMCVYVYLYSFFQNEIQNSFDTKQHSENDKIQNSDNINTIEIEEKQYGDK